MPVGIKNEQNTDMTFTGIHTQCLSCFYENGGKKIPLFEQKLKDHSFEQLCNLAASIQFTLFH